MYRYIPKEKRKDSNQANLYTTGMKSSNFELSNSNKDINSGCVYLPYFFCKEFELEIFNKLMKELEGVQIVNWSKHQKYENPIFSETFNEVVKKMAEYFNVKVMATRLNYYEDGNQWKPFHHDSHCYCEDGKEDFTMGASFGGERELVFLHEETKNIFTFPQRNGDVFAFNDIVNKKFLHGIPKKERGDKRISIIAWGKKL
jgi:hypothetical protein